MTTAGVSALEALIAGELLVTVEAGTLTAVGVLVVSDVLKMLNWFLSFSKTLGEVALLSGTPDVTGSPMISTRAGVL